MNNIRFDQYLLLICDLIKMTMVSPYDQYFHAIYLTCALYLDLEIQRKKESTLEGEKLYSLWCICV